MSAESPNTPNRTESNSNHRQNTVHPQPVTDPTILDSVAGFINEVVPVTSNDSFDSKDQIHWVHFENLDWDENSFLPQYNNEADIVSALILVLGYTTGIQVWAIPANGEAVEIFSWRHGSVKILKILPAPYAVESNSKDVFDSKRPIIALCDVAIHGPAATSVSFYSLKTGEQVKQIKFKSTILDVQANKRSVVITFAEKIAIFDAFTLEDKLSVTNCYLSPGPQPNPIALGARWLAFADKKLLASRRSQGGNEGEGVQSYTATVLHAAKSLGRGLRELGETVASSLTGNQSFKPGSPSSPQGGQLDLAQKGIVTVLDIESPSIQNANSSLQPEAVIAHFVAHTEAIVCLQFDAGGLLLMTADKRGHDFNVFRINSHPAGSALASVHHLYTLHRGDTSAKVQDMCFSFDSRWATVSTLRGTTHVFPITPYGGSIGVRTHTTPHVVNRMSRYHRSAGLTSEGRSNSPVSMYESPGSNYPFKNPRYPPFPQPTVVQPLAQIRQPLYVQNLGSSTPRTGRQRLTSTSEDNVSLRVVAGFAPPRAWIDPVVVPISRETSHNKQVKAVESLFVMSCHGNLVQYDLDPHAATNIPKERVGDESLIELSVTARAQWCLQRQGATVDIPLPMTAENFKFIPQNATLGKKLDANSNDDDWLSQVEILTHAGPHRRLWMGPQFTFKTYTTTNGTPMSVADAQPVDLSRSKPVNMPITKAPAVLIESGSTSSSEFMEFYRKNEEHGIAGEHQIKEDLADAMMESPSPRLNECGGRCVIVSMKSPRPGSVAKVVNPLGTVVTVLSDSEGEPLQTEDSDIFENCDEALFRPMVTASALAYRKPSKSMSNIMTKSLKSETEVTVQIKGKLSEVEDKKSTKPSSSPKEYFAKESSPKMSSGSPQESSSPKILNISAISRKNLRESSIPKESISQKFLDSPKEPSSPKETKTFKEFKETSSKLTKELNQTQSNPSTTKKSKKGKENVKSKSQTQPKESERLVELSVWKDQKEKSPPPFAVEKSLEKPISNVWKDKPSPLQFKELEKSVDFSVSNIWKEKKDKSIKSEPTSADVSEPAVWRDRKAKTSKTGIKNPPKELKQPVEEDTVDLGFETVEESFNIEILKPKKSILKPFEHFMDEAELISMPLIDKIVNQDFPPLEENFFSLEPSKCETFEDAEDCGLPLLDSDIVSDKINLPKDTDKADLADLLSSDTTGTDDNIAEKDLGFDKKKIVGKKVRKPKAKLGIKISGLNKDCTPERDVADTILAPPKRSWANIAAKSNKESDTPSDKSDFDEKSELSQCVQVEEKVAVTLPTKVYLTSARNKLIDIETPGELQKTILTEDLLKIDKSSDDEKVESGSSPIETTESDDSGKVKEIEGGVKVESVPVSKAGKKRFKKKKK